MKVTTPESSYNSIYAVNGAFVEIVKTNHLLFFNWANTHTLSVGGDNVIQVTLWDNSTKTFNLRTNNGATTYTQFILPLSCKSITITSEPT
jgi:hypothetical protein